MPNGPGADFNLGDFVYLPHAEDWGIGQVQSVIGRRVTVNFEHQGKQLIDTDNVRLLPADLPES
jgi:transcription elongation factor GreA-like protein